MSLNDCCYTESITQWKRYILLIRFFPSRDAQWLFYLWLPGNDEVNVLEVSWPDGSSFTRTLQLGEINSVVEVAYPKQGEMSLLANDTQVSSMDQRHELWAQVMFQSVSDSDCKDWSNTSQWECCLGADRWLFLLSDCKTTVTNEHIWFKYQLISFFFFQCGEGFTVKNGRCASR